MINEYDLVLANGTWSLVDCPPNVKPICWKCGYWIKYKTNGKIDKYIERHVDKGISQ